MKEVVIDKRTKEDVIAQIKELSKSYTPEWRYDEENGDMGTALANVYAEMFYRTLQLFNGLIKKNKISFFNQLEAKMLPAKASSGYVTFHLVDAEVQGVEVDSGTFVLADLPDEEHPKGSFETIEDLYVTPAKISHMIQVSDREDYISREIALEEGKSFIAFDLDGENQQLHEMYISHEDVFGIITKGTIIIDFYRNYLEKISEKIVNQFIDPEKISIEYGSKEGFIPFEEQSIENGSLILKKGLGQPSFIKESLEDNESYWIRFRVKEVKELLDFTIERIALKSMGNEIRPTVIYGAGIQCNQEEYMPFGRRMGIYQEVSFGSDEVLTKKGALIHLRFKLDFIKSPLDTNASREINWNWIMRPEDFRADLEFDITIGEVIWEYYNGKGWNRLFTDNSYRDVFSAEKIRSNQFIDIEFICPNDLDYLILESVGSYYIRARILNMNNEYKTNGYYITPVLSETYFDYEYQTNKYRTKEKIPQSILTKNNLEMRFLKGNDLSESNKLIPFKQTGTDKTAIYFGFPTAPLGGPIKVLFTMAETNTETPYPLRWEYYGSDKWKLINLIDETEQFRKTGLITMTGDSDFKKRSLFGRNLYWIRVLDENNYYHSGNEKHSLPIITGIYMNSTKAVATKSIEEEYFRMKQFSADKQFYLAKQEILDLTLWVEEGELNTNWVKWEQVEDFVDSVSNDRHYRLEATLGIVIFGNGRQGKIPPSSNQDNIKVQYRTGGGEYTNVKKNSIEKLDRSIGFINKVTNYEKFFGGCDKESLKEAMDRNSAYLKHRYRAVTTRDFEELALDVSHTIQKAACFTGCNAWGKPEPGCVTLVVLQKDYKHGKLYFQELKEQINSYIRPYMSSALIASNHFHIAEPEFVEINVNVSLLVENFQSIFQVKRQVLERLSEFLDPLYGNTYRSGWKIGDLPQVVQVKNAMSGIQGITMFQQITISSFVYSGQDKIEVELEEIKNNPFVLPVSGEHQVLVSVDRNKR